MELLPDALCKNELSFYFYRIIFSRLVPVHLYFLGCSDELIKSQVLDYQNENELKVDVDRLTHGVAQTIIYKLLEEGLYLNHIIKFSPHIHENTIKESASFF
jgi:hypothetical protein